MLGLGSGLLQDSSFPGEMPSSILSGTWLMRARLVRLSLPYPSGWPATHTMAEFDFLESEYIFTLALRKMLCCWNDSFLRCPALTSTVTRVTHCRVSSALTPSFPKKYDKPSSWDSLVLHTTPTTLRVLCREFCVFLWTRLLL